MPILRDRFTYSQVNKYGIPIMLYTPLFISGPVNPGGQVWECKALWAFRICSPVKLSQMVVWSRGKYRSTRHYAYMFTCRPVNLSITIDRSRAKYTDTGKQVQDTHNAFRIYIYPGPVKAIRVSGLQASRVPLITARDSSFWVNVLLLEQPRRLQYSGLLIVG